MNEVNARKEWSLPRALHGHGRNRPHGIAGPA